VGIRKYASPGVLVLRQWKARGGLQTEIENRRGDEEVPKTAMASFNAQSAATDRENG
jgi:hypothetical protein